MGREPGRKATSALGSRVYPTGGAEQWPQDTRWKWVVVQTGWGMFSCVGCAGATAARRTGEVLLPHAHVCPQVLAPPDVSDGFFAAGTPGSYR